MSAEPHGDHPIWNKIAEMEKRIAALEEAKRLPTNEEMYANHQSWLESIKELSGLGRKV